MMRINIAFSLLLCILYGLMFSFAFVFENCGSKLAKTNEILISSCNGSDEKCSFTRGTNVHISVKFTPNKDISDVIAYAFGKMLFFYVPLPMNKPEICKYPDFGLKCPLKKNQKVEYKASFIVDKNTPAVSVDLMWQLKNYKDEKIICIQLPVKIL